MTGEPASVQSGRVEAAPYGIRTVGDSSSAVKPLRPDGCARPLLPHLVACVTFFYDAARLAYLENLIVNYRQIAKILDLYIVTNTEDKSAQNAIRAAVGASKLGETVHLIVPTWMGHPYFLTWTHRAILETTLNRSDVTHFLYSEDDLGLQYENVEYWLQYRAALHERGLIPSFFRVEQGSSLEWCSTDVTSPVRWWTRPRVQVEPSDLYFIEMPNPYQGLYLLDRQLITELCSSAAMSPDFGAWSTREKAASGLTFVNPPSGFSARTVVPVRRADLRIPDYARVHHMPNNYALDPHSSFGKLRVDHDLFRRPSLREKLTSTAPVQVSAKYGRRIAGQIRGRLRSSFS